MSKPEAIDKRAINVEKTFQGAIRLSTIVCDRRVSMQYFGYTKREAMRLFTEELRVIQGGKRDH